MVRIAIEPGHSTTKSSTPFGGSRRRSRVCYTEEFGRSKIVATSTSLNLRAVLKTAVTRSGMDVPAAAISGLTDSAKALFVAAAALAQPKGVVLYVVPGDGDLEETCADVAFFLAALEGLGPGASERAVLPFPSHEVDPYRGLAPHIGVTSVRARALYAIAQGAARVGVSRRRPRSCPGSPAPSGCSQRRCSTQARTGHLAHGSRGAAGRRGVHPRGSGGRAR